eukprot:366021-Chlamydomonas_euryale.AAC.26
MPASSSRSALGPCPCPSDTCSNFLEKRISPASLSRSAIGSAPDESTKMSGVAGADSLKHVARSNGGGSMNLAPMCSETNACTALPTLSGRTHRSSASRWNAVSRDANGSASGASCASFESNSARYVGSSSAKCSTHTLSVIQLGSGFGTSIADDVGPASRKRHSPGSIISRFCNTFTRAADVEVERIGEALVEVLAALGHVGALGRVLDAADEEVDKPRERVLVHGVDEREVRDAEEEQRRADRDRAVQLARLVNLLLRHLGLGHCAQATHAGWEGGGVSV